MRRRTFLQALGLVAVAPLSPAISCYLPLSPTPHVETRAEVYSRYAELKRRKEREIFESMQAFFDSQVWA